MPTQWFRVPSDPDDGDQPKYSDEMPAMSAFRLGNSPRWVVKVSAEQSVINSLSSYDDVSEVGSSEAASAFGNDRGRSVSGEEIDRMFQV